VTRVSCVGTASARRMNSLASFMHLSIVVA
jgi:hypothetical protein